MRNRRSLLGLVVALLTAAIVWWTQGDGATPEARPGDTPSVEAPSPTEAEAPSPTQAPTGTTGEEGPDPDSGLPVVQEASLPPEAHETLALIDRGGPFPYEEDGTTFSNREGILPDHEEGYYKEHTVETPGLDHRGALRIVTGSGGEFYWTDDHYSSFSRIAREGG
jgi:ribonuclease T1